MTVTTTSSVLPPPCPHRPAASLLSLNPLGHCLPLLATRRALAGRGLRVTRAARRQRGFLGGQHQPGSRQQTLFARGPRGAWRVGRGREGVTRDCSIVGRRALLPAAVRRTLRARPLLLDLQSGQSPPHRQAELLQA